jgi:hypothetical protein
MGKRPRIGTPSKGRACDYKALQSRLSEDLVGKIASVNTALGEMKQGTFKDFREVMVDVIGKLFVPILEDQSSLISDLIEGMSSLEDKIESLMDEKNKDTERIRMLETCRESIELKTSRKDMTERIAVSSRQFKIMDVDFGKEVDDRKELLALAKEKMSDSVRSDKKARYEELVRHASLQVLARATTKRKQQRSEKEVWTAPILFAVDDRETRWELEDLLRSSNVFPTFHWNREMVGIVKEMRSSLKEVFPEKKHFIRIRPEERDGKWKIKADVKPKEGDSRFKPGATWDIPPMCPEVRKRNPSWIKPTWAQVAAGRNPTATAVSGTADRDEMEL